VTGTPSTSSSTCPGSAWTQSTWTWNATWSPSRPNARPREDAGEPLAAERPRGVFSRQLVLGDNLDTEHISASYNAGVLSLDIPVAEKAKPRKITVNSNGQDRQAINA